MMLSSYGPWTVHTPGECPVPVYSAYVVASDFDPWAFLRDPNWQNVIDGKPDFSRQPKWEEV